MTTQILQQLEHHQQAWPMHVSWMSSSSAWSKQRVTGDQSSDSSWEVRAFAEDASSSGQWPPRSYSCSFCQREFRTAQALGGHMNVHRRERAHQNQLANLRNLRVSSKSQQQPTTTVDLLTPKAEQRTLSTSLLTDPSTTTTAALSSSPPSQESINSCCSLISPPQEEHVTTKPLLNLDIILCETLSQQRTDGASRALYYHPYEKSSAAARCKPAHSSGSPGGFSLCLNKVMGEVHEDVLVDLELRLGRSSCTV